MFKAEELKYQLVRKELSLQALSDIMGITRQSLQNKLNGVTDWKYSELVAIRNLIGKKEFLSIFFED